MDARCAPRSFTPEASKSLLAGRRGEPSVGLEPTTPSLPWNDKGVIEGHEKASAGKKEPANWVLPTRQSCPLVTANADRELRPHCASPHPCFRAQGREVGVRPEILVASAEQVSRSLASQRDDRALRRTPIVRAPSSRRCWRSLGSRGCSRWRGPASRARRSRLGSRKGGVSFADRWRRSWLRASQRRLVADNGRLEPADPRSGLDELEQVPLGILNVGEADARRRAGRGRRHWVGAGSGQL
jgi:hypothetical protein